MSHRSAPGRTRKRIQTTAVSTPSPEASGPPQVLKFDFQPQAKPAAAPSRQRDDSIKQAIIRWLNEQL